MEKINRSEILNIKETFSGLYILEKLYQFHLFALVNQLFALLWKFGKFTLILPISCKAWRLRLLFERTFLLQVGRTILLCVSRVLFVSAGAHCTFCHYLYGDKNIIKCTKNNRIQCDCLLLQLHKMTYLPYRVSKNYFHVSICLICSLETFKID